MKFRKLIFWLHLITGVVAGVIIFIMSVTGVMIAYERQLTTLADGQSVTPPATNTTRLDIETLLARVRTAQSNTLPSTLTLRAEATAPVAFGYGRERVVFGNPYTGDVLGEGATKTRAFFHLMTDWHRWLGTNEKGRAVGKAITGACNLAFFFLVISGLYLWWPRNWSWVNLRGILIFNRGLTGKARDWNWHNVIGFWSCVPLFFIVLTAVVMSYPWANNLLYRLTGSEQPPAREGQRRPGGGRFAAPPSDLDLRGLNTLWAKVEQQSAGWRSISLRVPNSEESPVTFTVDKGSGGRPDLRSTITLEQGTGDVTKREDFSTYNTGRKLRTWVRWVHTGEAGGFLGQTLAMLASAGAVVLVWTGFAMAWRRFLNRKRINS